MVKNILPFLIAILFVVSFSLAQESASLEPWLDLIQDDPTLVELLTDLLENPLPINEASKKDWQRIPLLTSDEIDSILTQRNKQGTFSSVRKIRKIIGTQKYRRIRPFLTLHRVKKRWLRLTQRNYWTIETAPEITSQKFQGNKVYNLSRLLFEEKDHWQVGLVTQKDVGEPLFNDYWNGFVAYFFKKWQLIAGSYYLQLGQGLLFSAPFGQVKSSLSMSPFHATKMTVRPYLGTSENFAQTGFCLAGSWQNHAEYLFFWANNLRDGRYNSQTLKIIGFDFSGYHRSVAEQEKKDLIQERILGFSVKKALFNRLAYQLSAAQMKYTPSIDFNEENVSWNNLRRSRYQFKGQQLSVLSFNYDFNARLFRLSGELVASRQKTPGFTQSCWLKGKSLQTGLMFWNLSRNFQSPYGRAFDDANPFPRAVRGFYFALAWQKERWNFNFYKLIKKDLWRTYLSPFPGLHDEWLADLNYDWEDTNWQFRWRQIATLTNGFSTMCSNDWRVQMTMMLNKKIEFKCRVQYVQIKPLKEDGLLSYQQLHWHFQQHFWFTLRFSFYRTDSYQSRIYEYESDVPGSFANFPLYGDGYKWFYFLRWQPLSSLQVWLKFRYQMISDKKLTDIDYGKNSSQLERMIRLQISLKI